MGIRYVVPLPFGKFASAFALGPISAPEPGRVSHLIKCFGWNDGGRILLRLSTPRTLTDHCKLWSYSVLLHRSALDLDWWRVRGRSCSDCLPTSDQAPLAPLAPPDWSLEPFPILAHPRKRPCSPPARRPRDRWQNPPKDVRQEGQTGTKSMRGIGPRTGGWGQEPPQTN